MRIRFYPAHFRQRNPRGSFAERRGGGGFRVKYAGKSQVFSKPNLAEVISTINNWFGWVIGDNEICLVGMLVWYNADHAHAVTRLASSSPWAEMQLSSRIGVFKRLLYLCVT